MNNSTILTIAPPKTISARADALRLIDEFLATLDAQVRSDQIAETTRATYASGISRFVDYAISCHAVDSNVIRSWIAHLRESKCKSSTINTWLSGVRAFFNWAMSEGKISYNPAKGIKGGRRIGTRSRHRRDRLTDAEVLRVLAAPDDSIAGIRNRAYLALRAYTGVRDIELCRADISDIRTRGSHTVLYIQGKGHSEPDDFVVLVPDSEHPLRDWLSVRGEKPGPLFTSCSNRTMGGRLSLRAIRWMVKSTYRRAGITEKTKTSHSLRHSAITNAIEHGAPIQKTQAMARHADIGTTAIYFHESDRLENPAEERICYDHA